MENPVARKISLAEEHLQDSGSTSKINVEVGVGGVFWSVGQLWEAGGGRG